MEQVDLKKYLADETAGISAYMHKKAPDSAWMLDVQKIYFEDVYKAQENGKALILTGPNYPPELIWACGGVPFLLDTLPTRLASTKMGAIKYIDIAEKYVPSYACALNKVGVGAVLSGEVGEADAVMYSSTPCDSGRSAYPAIADYLGIPSLCIDTPFKQDERGFAYIADELRRSVPFLEEVCGQKLDWSKLAQVIEYSNRGYELLGKIAKLRQMVPCPIPGRFLVLNEFFGAMVGRPEILDFLEREYQMGKANVDKSRGAIRGEEKYRIAWMQNMPWSNVGILDWLEQEYGAIVAIDFFAYQFPLIIDDPWNEDEVFKGLAKRVLAQPMTHGSAGPVEPALALAESTVVDYKCDLAIFAGHVGCKHTWAVGKMIEDVLYDKYGVKTLTLDFDAVDSRYKGHDEVKATIKEFMDSIIGR